MEKNLIDLIKDGGVVGAGGAGFPTHVKLNAKAEYVIVNGAECEPLLCVDQQLMAQQPERLLQALSLAMEQTGAKHGIIALKEKYHEAVEALSAQLPRYPAVRLQLLGAFYPAGDEQVTVYEATGKIIPEGGIPLNVGVVVSNVETMLNLLSAYENQTPVTEKYVTLTGAVRERKTVLVPLGITVSEALALAGGPIPKEYAVVNGGPMMGRIVAPDSRITKTTKGLIVLPKEHPLLKSLNKSVSSMLREAKTACMNCSLCTEVCPRNMLGHRLEPHKLMRTASYGGLCDKELTPVSAYLCCGCRLCEYACVMDLQPWKLNGVLKEELGKNQIKNNMHETPKSVNPFRSYKKFPVHRLIYRLGLSEYDQPAPLTECTVTFSKVGILLKQHTGAPAEPIKKVGERVCKGELIAEMKDGKLGASLHASISGMITDITAEEMIIRSE